MDSEPFTLSDERKAELIASRTAINRAKQEVQKAKDAGLITGSEQWVKDLIAADEKIRKIEAAYLR